MRLLGSRLLELRMCLAKPTDNNLVRGHVLVRLPEKHNVDEQQVSERVFRQTVKVACAPKTCTRDGRASDVGKSAVGRTNDDTFDEDFSEGREGKRGRFPLFLGKRRKGDASLYS